PERMVLYFATAGPDFEVLEPPEVVRAVEAVAQRLGRAKGR
ncbi:transcriptional regulator, partial [Mycolicibacterium pulveris]